MERCGVPERRRSAAARMAILCGSVSWVGQDVITAIVGDAVDQTAQHVQAEQRLIGPGDKPEEPVVELRREPAVRFGHDRHGNALAAAPGGSR